MRQSQSDFLSKHDGFSLIQVMVGIALTSIMTLVVAQTMAHLSQSSRRIDSKNSTQALSQGLQVYLANENICSNSLAATQIISFDKVDLRFDIPGFGRVEKAILNHSTQLLTDAVYVKELTLFETNSLGMKIYGGPLSVSLSRQNGNATDSFAARKVGVLSLMTDPGGRVIKCVLGPLKFAAVPDGGAQVPDVSGPGGGGSSALNGSGGSGNPDNSLSKTDSASCSSVEQCAVYDYFARNGVPSPYTSADKWMNESGSWKTVARSYVDSMSTLGKLNFLASVDQAGLVQSSGKIVGTDQPNNTIDQWVADTVFKDPSGKSMLATKNGIETIQYLFDRDSKTSEVSKSILRTALTKSPDITMNSALGITTWVEALGYSSATAFAKANPSAAMASALSTGAVSDAQALKEVITFMQNNPEASVAISQGTGIWSKYAAGGTKGVIQTIAATVQQVGGTQLLAQIAQGSTIWSNSVGNGSVGNAVGSNAQIAAEVAYGTSVWSNAVGQSAVANAVQGNTAAAAQVAHGTAVATQVFGSGTVNAAIGADAAAAAALAQQISQYAQQSGATVQQMQDYIKANPNSWQQDLSNATKGK